MSMVQGDKGIMSFTYDDFPRYLLWFRERRYGDSSQIVYMLE